MLTHRLIRAASRWLLLVLAVTLLSPGFGRGGGARTLRTALAVRHESGVRVRAAALRAAMGDLALVSAVALGGALLALASAGRAFLPDFNEGRLTVNVMTLPGTSLEQSDRLAQQVENILLARSEVVAMAAGQPGSEIQVPMAVVILCGLMTSTVLNIIVVPALCLRFGSVSQHYRPHVPGMLETA